MKKIYTSVLALFLTGATFSQTLKINEFMASNVATIADEANEYDDWFEIFNPGATAVDVGGYYVTDNATAITKYKFPSGNPITIIPAGGHLLVWADDSVEQGALHTNFKLSKGGEFIGLLTPDSVYIDSLSFGAQSDDKSYGRTDDGSLLWKVFDIPTPGSPNSVSTASIVLLKEEKIIIFPNPANEVVYVKTNQNIILLRLMDLNGTLIKESNENKIDLTTLEQGVYFIQVYTNEGFTICKMLKK
jgi:hypothetical protein